MSQLDLWAFDSLLGCCVLSGVWALFPNAVSISANRLDGSGVALAVSGQQWHWQWQWHWRWQWNSSAIIEQYSDRAHDSVVLHLCYAISNSKCSLTHIRTHIRTHIQASHQFCGEPDPDFCCCSPNTGKQCSTAHSLRNIQILSSKINIRCIR